MVDCLSQQREARHCSIAYHPDNGWESCSLCSPGVPALHSEVSITGNVSMMSCGLSDLSVPTKVEKKGRLCYTQAGGTFVGFSARKAARQVEVCMPNNRSSRPIAPLYHVHLFGRFRIEQRTAQGTYQTLRPGSWDRQS